MGRAETADSGPGTAGACPRVVVAETRGCIECRRLAPIIDRVAGGYPEVEVERFDVSADPGRARRLGLYGTPTVIGYRDGNEQVRFTGHRSPAEVDSVFAGLRSGEAMVAGPAAVEIGLRAIAGAGVLGAGAASGPSPVLLVIGALLSAYAVAGLVGRRRR